ncbi:MAG: ERCC4 domain-containing protein [Planctomycetota bacterium]
MSFRIVIDTREQLPYGFTCETIRRRLEAGDYSVEGFEALVAVERKSLADFASTVIHDRARFERELVKLRAYQAACIVVEADLDAILRGEREVEMHAVAPASLLGASLEITLRHRIPVFWCGSRQAACLFTGQYLRMFVRHHLEALR